MRRRAGNKPWISYLIIFILDDYDNSESDAIDFMMVKISNKKDYNKVQEEAQKFYNKVMDSMFKKDKRAFLKEHPGMEFTRDGWNKDMNEDYGTSTSILEIKPFTIKQL